MRANEYLKPEVTKEEAYKLVSLIKQGSDYSGMLVIKSLANTLRYVTYSHTNYKWDLKDKKIKKV